MSSLARAPDGVAPHLRYTWRAMDARGATVDPTAHLLCLFVQLFEAKANGLHGDVESLSRDEVRASLGALLGDVGSVAGQMTSLARSVGEAARRALGWGDAEALAEARPELEAEHDDLMIERFVDGRELTVGIALGQVLPTIEIVASSGFYDYEAKYERDDTDYIVNPDLPEGIDDACRRHALTTFEALGCRDLARVDFMLDDKGPWLLEVNTIPGFTDHSLVPKAAGELGIGMTELCARLVECAMERTETGTPRN